MSINQIKKEENTPFDMTQDLKSTLESINKSSLNTSKSKAMYSFTKATRWMPFKQTNSSFYEKPPVSNKRAASFGYGCKSQLVQKYRQSIPSPDQYESKSNFDLSPKKGLSIGLGRDDCKNVSIFNTSKYPSPTHYVTNQENKENSCVYSMRAKVKLPELFPDGKTPGPGQYSVGESINNKNGQSFNSKYKTNICFKIHQKSSQINHKKAQTPILGPLTYQTDLPSTGKQILSKKKTQKSFYFDRRPRVTLHINSQSPGPGAYTSFSEFNR